MEKIYLHHHDALEVKYDKYVEQDVALKVIKVEREADRRRL